MDLSTLVMTLCVVAFTATAAFIDWRWGKIPNWLTVSCFAAALLFHFFVGFLGWDGEGTGGWLSGFERLMWAMLGFATGFGILLVLWLTAGGLGGDVKLMGAIGAWLLPSATLYVFLVACLLVAVLMAWSIAWKLLNGRWHHARRDLGKEKKPGKNVSTSTPWRRAIPFGVPVAFATWGVLAFQIIQGK